MTLAFTAFFVHKINEFSKLFGGAEAPKSLRLDRLGLRSLFPDNEGSFPENRKGIFMFITKSLGASAPRVPLVPTGMLLSLIILADSAKLSICKEFFKLLELTCFK